MRKIINVPLEGSPYKLYIGNSFISQIPYYAKKLNLGNFCVLITQGNILSLHKNRINSLLKSVPCAIIKVVDGEKAKSKKWVFYIIQEMIKKENIKRKIFIASLGGGVINDLGGFVASVYKRGVPCIHIPTTLLAQVDASIGGKTAINLDQAKNMVGTFYQPKAVFIDPKFLHTLDPRELTQGYAEIIKYAVIKDRHLFMYLSRYYSRISTLDAACIIHLIETCARIKAGIISKDEKELLGLRTLLNFGHTIGHGLESACKYTKQLTHGDAVALGMLAASLISFNLGICTNKDVEELYQLIQLYGLPTKLSFDPKKVLKSIMYDKKFVSNTIRMVLIEKIGKAVVYEKIPLKSIKNGLNYIRQ